MFYRVDLLDWFKSADLLWWDTLNLAAEPGLNAVDSIRVLLSSVFFLKPCVLCLLLLLPPHILHVLTSTYSVCGSEKSSSCFFSLKKIGPALNKFCSFGDYEPFIFSHAFRSNTLWQKPETRSCSTRVKWRTRRTWGGGWPVWKNLWSSTSTWRDRSLTAAGRHEGLV